ncbi:MAG: hypothetical protein ACK54J_04555 [Pseudanabaena sp.]
MAELRSAIFWVLNCPIYLLRCYITKQALRPNTDLAIKFTNWLTRLFA